MKITALFLFLVLLMPISAVASDLQIINKDELRNLLGSQNLIVLDVRTGSDWTSSGFKIKGAVREDPKNVSSWVGNYSKDKTYVLYCA